MTVFFTSDTHFGDPRVLRIDRRPFANIPEHDEALIERWNETVGPQDEIWHLGDFALHVRPGRIEELLARLHGRKHLITGNNDGPDTLAAKDWASVQAYAELQLEGYGLVLCHYAFRTWKNMGRGWIDLHGHSHGKLKPQTRQFDVGVDAWDYRPITLEQILGSSRIRHRKTGP
ncbi:metallophosphoesterase family protein [Microvirga sp. 17 mud 1-3]|uniref:metallophosphoesterase family protein n=1 Tax=Microvirga sp. 17 mud 1-3 TaxID=2082949 RepID=UPI000D6D558F|nr:metallophosphoesterase family protein [Microvirga sp. 17 mud 1-3]AWM85763.1 metallophosphoesterase [Microvirga sp. 17 mud 1-3]